MMEISSPISQKWRVKKILWVLIGVGAIGFGVQLLGGRPERAWQAYLINFLVFSAMAQGGLLFSAIMHLTRARWSGPLSNLAESFTAFFPISFGLFLLLLPAKEKLFPWMHMDLHGKEVWLNLPFLFARDAAGLLLLYALGFAYLYHALWFKLEKEHPRGGGIRLFLHNRWLRSNLDAESFRRRLDVLSILYMLAFALVLSLIGYDLVMSMDPHWYSTLFGAYAFVKAIYIGLGGLILVASALHLTPGVDFRLKPAQFHDVGKLFFAFCLVWADFFYCQFVVIWYGNIPEDTAYIIERTLASPWNRLAWVVFFTGFIVPFLILLNRAVKTKPKAMIAICLLAIGAIWLEHLLLLGPALSRGSVGLPVGIWDAMMFLGFSGLMVLSLIFFLDRFPEMLRVEERKDCSN